MALTSIQKIPVNLQAVNRQEVTVQVTRGSLIRAMTVEGEQAYMHIQCDPAQTIKDPMVVILLMGEGDLQSVPKNYLGSFFMNHLGFLFHAFEKG